DVVLYEVSGLGFSPTQLWLDREGGLFAEGSSWTMVIRRGWEPVADELVRVQTEVESARYRDLARRLTRRPEGDVVFRGVSLFDSTTGTLTPDRDVVVRRNRIVRVGRSPLRIGRKTTIVDGRGRTLLPGLWDMHVHMGPDDGLLDIAAGVTSVRDLAND